MTFGEEMAKRVMDDNAVVTMAALDGNLEALTALVALACQQSYTSGMSVTANTLGFPL